MLDIRLIGPPRVYLDGVLYPVARAKTRALLFYLAVNPKPVRREQLCELLWPEQEGKKQRENFRRYLSHLKEAFPGKEIVETYPGMVGLVRSTLQVDILRLVEAVEKMRVYSASRQDEVTFPLSLYQELVSVADLWEEGDIFVDSNDLDDSVSLSHWREEKDQEVQQVLLELYTFLARTEDSQGKPEKAILFATKALALYPYEESLQVVLLENLRKLGQLNKARRHYSMLCEDDDFAGIFSNEFHHLREELLHQREASPSYVRPVWKIRSSAPSFFVGQKEPLELLKSSYHTGVGALILGEAGGGKTRLVQEFYQSLDAAPRLLLLPCSRTDENIPYYPWINMLRRSFAPDFWQETPAVWTKPLVMLLPELAEIRDDLNADLREVYAAPIIFDAIRKLLTFVYHEEACLLVVDDAQWADRASLSIIAYLLRESFFRHPSVSLIITSRMEEQNPELENLMISSFEEIILIELLRLREEEIAQLAYYVLNKRLPMETLTHLREQTGGNPFYLLELLHHRFLREEKERIDFEALVIPPKVKRNIEVRLERLSSSARDLLLLAAIQGNPFELSVLEKAAGLSLEQTSQIIGELEKAQLIYLVEESAELKYTLNLVRN